jgi:hypothetical protein
MNKRKFFGFYLWISLYLIINLFAIISIVSYNKLLGETSGIDINPKTPVLLIGFFVILSYIIILGPIHNQFYKINFKFIPFADVSYKSGKSIGSFLLLLQLGFIIFAVYDGNLVAGATERSASIWSFFFVLFSPDILFLFYYAYYRNSNLYAPNAIAAILSALTRGWFGILMTLFILESIRMIRNKKMSYYIFVAASISVVIIFPLFQILKIGIRSFASDNVGALDYMSILSSILTILNYNNYLETFYGMFNIIVERLQIVSHWIVGFQNSDYLLVLYEQGDILPFWLEGLHGSAFYRLMGENLPNNIGIQFANILDPYNTTVNWNANPGLLVWWFMSPVLGIGYTFYVIILLILTQAVLKSFKGNSLELRDVLWFSWLAFLIPGWTGVLYLFFHSALIFYLIHHVRELFINNQFGLKSSK